MTDFPTKRTIVACPSIIELAKVYTLADVSMKLGVGYSTCTKYVKTGVAPATAERLAKFLVQKTNGGRPANDARHALIMVKVPHQKLELVKTFLKGADVKYSHFEMD